MYEFVGTDPMSPVTEFGGGKVLRTLGETNRAVKGSEMV
jgi:hypothetical protein